MFRLTNGNPKQYLCMIIFVSHYLSFQLYCHCQILVFPVILAQRLSFVKSTRPTLNVGYNISEIDRCETDLLSRHNGRPRRLSNHLFLTSNFSFRWMHILSRVGDERMKPPLCAQSTFSSVLQSSASTSSDCVSPFSH